MKDIIDMSRHRGYFIDQSQSLNLFMEGASLPKITSMHFYAWKSGLKTGMYYLRTKSAVDAIKFTLNNEKKAEAIPEVQQVVKMPVPVEVKAIDVNEFKTMIDNARNSGADDCEMCGS
jgi:ribonucleoside-diphosphate reductase alpha chain